MMSSFLSTSLTSVTGGSYYLQAAALALQAADAAISRSAPLSQGIFDNISSIPHADSALMPGGYAVGAGLDESSLFESLSRAPLAAALPAPPPAHVPLC